MTLYFRYQLGGGEVAERREHGTEAHQQGAAGPRPGPARAVLRRPRGRGHVPLAGDWSLVR